MQDLKKITAIKKIIEINCKVKDISKTGLHSQHVEQRNLYCYLSRKYTSSSYALIGTLIDREHTSVMHGIKTISNFIATDQLIDKELFLKSQRETSLLIEQYKRDAKSSLIVLDKQQIINKFKIAHIKIMEKYRLIINSQSAEILELKKTISNLENERLILYPSQDEI